MIRESVMKSDVAMRLRDRDVIFLCTDDHWGRSIVNQVAYQYLIPTINLGVRIAAPSSRIEAAIANVDVLRPDLPCLWCKQALSSSRIAAESLPAAERESLAAEGYVEGLTTPTPSVIGLTTTCSGLAVNVFLNLLTGFMGEAGEVMRLQYDMLTSQVSRGRTSTAEKCICQQVRGCGDLRLLPTQP
jgi:hypothetical protein